MFGGVKREKLEMDNNKYKPAVEFELDDKGKLKIQEKCKFSGSGFDDNHELGECSVALQIIPKVNNVLEIGGGAGKVSHMINLILQKRGLGRKHIVMEPGSGGNGNHGDIHLWKNKEIFKDKYTILFLAIFFHKQLILYRKKLNYSTIVIKMDLK